ncbi:hypothetical protein RLDS_03955 [Sphingobium lactosutens DS20]|uniref:Uncharacterized protein n=1 Tax=Sphingobium lactosutens DS20 TaxID=1331060 RepID=T0HZF7_9SPHN|nr:hypothetical protein RLDS_03955 [Sphingobium lactosutens DS20]
MECEANINCFLSLCDILLARIWMYDWATTHMLGPFMILSLQPIELDS